MNIKSLIFQQSFPEVLEEFRSCHKIPEEKLPQLEAALQGLWDELQATEPLPSDDVLFLVERIEQGERYLDFGTYKLQDLELWQKAPSSHIPLPSLSEIFQLSKEQCLDFIHKQNLPQGYFFTYSSRNTVLGFQIHPTNVEYFGALPYVVEFLSELTFFGFQEEDVVAERDELDRIAKEADEARLLSPEEQAEYFTPADKIWEKLGIVDTRTEEEREANRLEGWRETVHQFANIQQMLQWMYPEHSSEESSQ